MDLYILTKTIHILSSTILFGTGIGIAFFMFRSMSTDNLQEKYYAARNTVLADSIFTLPAVIIQPISGIALINMVGYDWTDFWLLTAYVLYVVIGLCWIPVVWIQIQLKNMLSDAINNDTALPARYDKLSRIWFFLGWPAFAGLIFIFYLMISKPA
ncbi:MAG: DUF2269 family protein [Gammaproteobacteria bacterium]|jgi:uncharacterized membrane protein